MIYSTLTQKYIAMFSILRKICFTVQRLVHLPYIKIGFIHKKCIPIHREYTHYTVQKLMNVIHKTQVQLGFGFHNRRNAWPSRQKR